METVQQKTKAVGCSKEWDSHDKEGECKELGLAVESLKGSEEGTIATMCV